MLACARSISCCGRITRVTRAAIIFLFRRGWTFYIARIRIDATVDFGERERMCLESVANWIGCRTAFSSIVLNSGLLSLTNGIAFLNAVFSEGDLFADNDITLDTEVSEFAALLERLVCLLFSGTAIRLFFVDLTNVWNGLMSQRLMSFEIQVSGSDGSGGAERKT